MMKLGLTLASAALALVTLSSTTHATLLPNGTVTAAPSVITLGSFTTLATSTQNFTGVSADPSAPTPFTGSFTTSVINEGSANSLGGLTFVYDFGNNGPNTLRRFTATNFGGFTVDVGYDGPGPIVGAATINPLNLDRSSTASDNGAVIGFDFTGGTQPGVAAGQSSSYLVIRTNANSFRTGGVSIIDGGTANVPAFAPTSVPEPGTMVAALLGLTAIGGLRLRRRVK